MKHVLLILVFLLSANISYAGKFFGNETLDSDWTYQIVEETPELSKEQIYSNTLAWFAEEFVSSKEVIQLQDKENGKIIGK